MIVIIEPKNIDKAKKDPQIWKILYKGELNRFIEAYSGRDRRLMDYVVNTWNNGVCRIHENEIIFNDQIISKAIGLPNIGKEVKHNSKESKFEDFRRFEGDQI